MDPRDHLKAYVASQGGLPDAAKKLRMPYQTLRGIVAGWRGVSRKQARHMAIESGGALDAGQLVWIRPTKGEGISNVA